jgi:hypothetical protein
VQYETQKDGHKNIRIGFNISPINPTIYEQTSLLQAQARMPNYYALNYLILYQKILAGEATWAHNIMERLYINSTSVM